MRTSVLIGLVAGSALSAGAYAQDNALTPMPLKGIVPRVVTPNYVVAGPEVVNRGIGRFRPGGIIYDRISFLDSYFWFGYLANAKHADDVSMSPGPQSALFAPGGQLITGMDLIFANEDLSGIGRNFDLVVTFWDTGDPVAAAGVQCYNTLIDGWITSISALPAGFWIIGWNLTGLPAGGVQLTDDGAHMEIAFYEFGTAFLDLADPLNPGGKINGTYPHLSGLGNLTVAFNSNFTYKTSGNQLAGSNIYGYSNPWWWWDSGGNGVCETGERWRAGGDPGYYMPPDMTVNLYGDIRCKADYNNDGFVDPLDFTAFNNDYVLGDSNPPTSYCP